MEEEVCSDDMSRMFLELGFVFLKEDGSLCKIWVGGPETIGQLPSLQACIKEATM